jgi:hypothetical protein
MSERCRSILWYLALWEFLSALNVFNLSQATNGRLRGDAGSNLPPIFRAGVPSRHERPVPVKQKGRRVTGGLE